MTATKISWRLPPSKLKLSTKSVHVWRVRLNQADGSVQQLQQILSDDERLRAESFHFDRDRRRFIVSQGTLRLIIGDYINMAPSRLQFYSGHRGKPYLINRSGNVPLQFNLAHSKEIALYAVTCSREIGIDVEYVRDMPDAEKIAQMTFSSIENKMLQSLPQYQQQEAFFNCWVRKEAYIKAIGDGLYHALDRFDVSLAPGEPARLESVDGSAENASCWFMKSLTPEDGYVAALAVKGSDFCFSYWEYPEKRECMMAKQYIKSPNRVNVLWDSLQDLQKVFTQPDFLAAARQHAKGKLTIQEKVILLFDSGTFSEDLAPNHELDSRHGERRILTGYGRINNRLVSAAIFDSSIAAGALNPDMGEKLLKHMRRSEENRCPLLIDWDCGGGDIRSGIMVMDIFGRIFTQINEISGRIPTLSIISGLNAGGAAYATVMTDTVIMIDDSMMAVTGPVEIKVATGEEVTPDEMGGAQLHAEKSGEAHYRVPDYNTAAQLARRYFSYLPQSMFDFPPKAKNGKRTQLGLTCAPLSPVHARMPD